VARIGDVLVGAGALVIQDARDGQIVRGSVDPPHRCRGIGRALVTRLLDAARARGLTRVWMETNDDWHAAIAPYRHYTPQAQPNADLCVESGVDETNVSCEPGGRQSWKPRSCIAVATTR